MKKQNLFVLISIIISFFMASAQEYKIYEKIQSLTDQVSTARLKADIEKLAGFYNRNTFSDTVSDIKGIGAARRWIFSEFERINRETGSRMKVYFDNFIHKLSQRYQRALGIEQLKMANVIAVIPGTKSDRTLLFNGHYDSRSYSGTDTEGYAPGANDDGTGTAALLEMARILAGKKLDNTIILAACTGEEQGLLGSSHIAKDAKEKGMSLEAVIANDMIGNTSGGDGKSDNTVLRCFSPDPVESPSRNFALYLNKISDEYFPQLNLKMIFRLDRFGRGGDHSPFIRQGFAGVRFTEPFENYKIQHSPYDTPENMDFEYFTKTTQLNTAIAAYWANSPAPPMLISIRRDSIYQTLLSFTCPEPEEHLEGFKVYMRETDSGYWTESKLFPKPDKVSSRTFGEAYRIILKNRDQDYYIFGIVSVNKDGYESIAATYDRQKIREIVQQRRQR